MHLINSSYHQHVHDVVRVEDEIHFTREPLFRNVDFPDVSANNWQDVLHDDIVGGVGCSSSPRTNSKQKAADTYAEGGGEGKPPTPDGRDCHGLVEAHDTNE